MCQSQAGPRTTLSPGQAGCLFIVGDFIMAAVKTVCYRVHLEVLSDPLFALIQGMKILDIWKIKTVVLNLLFYE